MKQSILRCTLFLSFSLLVSVPPLRAQTLVPEPGGRVTRGSDFNAASNHHEPWNHEIGPFNVDGPVYETAIAPNGDLYIGGEFTTVGGVQANRIARWDGTMWHALGSGIAGGPVYAITFRNNEVIVGGNFGLAGVDVKASNIARWNGTAWSSFGDITREGLDSSVLALAVHNGEIYAAGNFTYSGNQDVMNYIAKWSDADTLFLSLDDGTRRGTDGGIATMVVANDSLYIGGTFTKAGGTNASRIAKWNGTRWSSLTNGVGMQGGGGAAAIYSLAVQDSLLYVGGTFTFAGGKPIRNIARWNLASNTWLNVGNGGLDSTVYRVAVNDSGEVFTTGIFMNSGNGPAARVARWKGGVGWTGLAEGLDNAGHALAIDGDYVWVGGIFGKAGDVTTPYLARWTNIEEPESGVDAGEAGSTTIRARIQPNPVSGVCAMNITLPSPGSVSLSIVDCRGIEVMTMPATIFDAGTHAVRLDAGALPNGVYFCRVAAGTGIATTPFVVAK